MLPLVALPLPNRHAIVCCGNNYYHVHNQRKFIRNEENLIARKPFKRWSKAIPCDCSFLAVPFDKCPPKTILDGNSDLCIQRKLLINNVELQESPKMNATSPLNPLCYVLPWETSLSNIDEYDMLQEISGGVLGTICLSKYCFAQSSDLVIFPKISMLSSKFAFLPPAFEYYRATISLEFKLTDLMADIFSSHHSCVVEFSHEASVAEPSMSLLSLSNVQDQLLAVVFQIAAAILKAEAVYIRITCLDAVSMLPFDKIFINESRICPQIFSSTFNDFSLSSLMSSIEKSIEMDNCAVIETESIDLLEDFWSNQSLVVEDSYYLKKTVSSLTLMKPIIECFSLGSLFRNLGRHDFVDLSIEGVTRRFAPIQSRVPHIELISDKYHLAEAIVLLKQEENRYVDMLSFSILQYGPNVNFKVIDISVSNRCEAWGLDRFLDLSRSNTLPQPPFGSNQGDSDQRIVATCVTHPPAIHILVPISATEIESAEKHMTAAVQAQRLNDSSVLTEVLKRDGNIECDKLPEYLNCFPIDDSTVRSEPSTVVVQKINQSFTTSEQLSDLPTTTVASTRHSTFIVSEKFFEHRCEIVTHLSVAYQLTVCDALTCDGADVILSADAAVFLIDCNQFTNHMERASLLRAILDSSCRYSRIYVIVQSFKKSDSKPQYPQLISKFYQAFVRCPCRIIIRDSIEFDAISLGSLLLQFSSFEWKLFRDSVPVTCSRLFGQCPFLQLLKNEVFLAHCDFLQRFPSMNIFLASMLLSVWSLKELLTGNVCEISSRAKLLFGTTDAMDRRILSFLELMCSMK